MDWIIKIHIFHHAAQEPVYGLALIHELQRHGYELGPGTLHPILHSMEKSGYLDRDDRVMGGKVRKYYTITDEGRTALEETRAKVAELVHEVVEGERPSHLVGPDDPEEGTSSMDEASKSGHLGR